MTFFLLVSCPLNSLPPSITQLFVLRTYILLLSSCYLSNLPHTPLFSFQYFFSFLTNHMNTSSLKHSSLVMHFFMPASHVIASSSFSFSLELNIQYCFLSTTSSYFAKYLTCLFLFSISLIIFSCPILPYAPGITCYSHFLNLISKSNSFFVFIYLFILLLLGYGFLLISSNAR